VINYTWLKTTTVVLLVFCVNKLVKEIGLFCPGKSEKSQRKWILQSRRNHAGRCDLSTL